MIELKSASAIVRLRQEIEQATNKTFTNLKEAVNVVSDGYGQGGPEIPENAKFKIITYTEDGYPLEVGVGAEGDTATPVDAFATSSGSWTFASKINKVYLPSTVTTISQNGLYKLTNLKEVVNWDNITEIAYKGAAQCSSLEHTHLPLNLITIGTEGFANSRLPITELPESLISINANAFYRVTGMNIQKLNEGLETIGYGAFYTLGTTGVSFSEIPASVKTIGTQAFYGACQGIVGSLKFKGTPVSIAANAFEKGTKITDVYVPWAEGELEGAPWGMTNATIHYNTVYDENGDPIETEE